MQKWIRFSTVCAALLLAAGVQALTVGSNGQAGYGIPLTVPPGISGMQPNIALSYADGGVNGPLGVGWSLQGISAITRCPSSRVVDGVVQSDGTKALTGNSRPTVRFDAYDRLCLDGQRLVVTGANGAPLGNTTGDAAGLSSGVREFRTEKDSFARIRAYGMADSSNPDAGPAYFKVWTKAGQIYEYGTSPSGSAASAARINAQGTTRVAVWAVSRVSDTQANYIDFKYEVRSLPWGSGPTTAGLVGQEWNIAELQYTGTATSAPKNKVIFEYEDRPDNNNLTPADRSEAYQGASKNISVRRLKAIRSYVNATDPTTLGKGASAVLVRAWMLAYEASPRSGRSRLSQVRECADEAGARCLPATSLAYSNGAVPNYTVNTGFASSPVASVQLLDTTGARGTLTGDFNGDGKTDIIRTSDNPAENELYFSTGQGGFSKQAGFTLTRTTDNLIDKNGCYSSQVIDINGDGLSDILRIVKPACNTGRSSSVFISNGDGTFTERPILSSIDFEQLKSKEFVGQDYCTVLDGAAPGTARSASAGGAAAPAVTTAVGPTSNSAIAKPTVGDPAIGGLGCWRTSYSQGKRFHLIDVNGDGLVDIVTTLLPMTTWNSAWGQMPALTYRCSQPGIFFASDNPICTRVFINQGNGSFVEVPNHPNAKDLLYVDLPTNRLGLNPYWRVNDEADFDGDGLSDLFTYYNGVWRSKGDGTFEPLTGNIWAASCSLPIDFNGDARADCLRPSNDLSLQSLFFSLGGATQEASRFNLKTSGDELYSLDKNQQQTMGVLVEDFDGDGRQDIFRWSTNSAQNGIYLSNGDGSFRARSGAGLTGLGDPLTAVDGSKSFITGDFLGTGSLQIIQLLRSDVASTKFNVMLALDGDRTPMDQLISVTTGSGVSIKVDAREPMTSPSVYTSDRGTPNAATGSMVDLTLPSYVIKSTTKSSPGYGDVQTQYSYLGFKAERNGRGMLGFRETRRQNKAPNGLDDITIVTRNFLSYPYTGVASVAETYLGGLSLAGAKRLSRTTYSYCDKTSAAVAQTVGSPGNPPAPCATSALVQRPYLYQSVEEGWDLSNQQLPMVVTTNAYNDSGDPTSITVETSGLVTNLGLTQAQVFKKTVVNSYKPNATDGDNWILGRLEQSSVTQSAPNSLPQIATSAGNGTYATQRDGSGPLNLGNQSVAVLTSANPAVLPSRWWADGLGNSTATLTLRNGGTKAMSLTGLSGLPSRVAVKSNNCTSIAANNTCQITLELNVNVPLASAGDGSFSVQTTGADTNANFSVVADLYTAINRWETTSLSFGDVAVGARSAPQVVRVQNVGAGTINWKDAPNGGLKNLPAGFSAALAGDCASVAKNAYCTVTLTFAPTAAGAVTSTTVAPLNISGSDNLLTLSGNGKSQTGSLVAVTASPLNAGTTLTPYAYSGGHVTFKNGGNGPLTISANPTVTNQAGAYVTQGEAGWCYAGAVLQPNATCLVYVMWNVGPGPQSTTLTVSSDGGSQQVVVNATFAGAVTSTGASFGDVVVGSYADRTVTITNTAAFGARAMTYQATAPYSIPSNGCGATLAAGTSCQMTVRYSPTASGASNGNVQINATYNQTYNGGATETANSGNANTYLAALSGQGVTAGQLVYDTMVTNVEDADGFNVSFWFKNTGGSPVSVAGNDIQVSGSSLYATAYIESGTTCTGGATVAALNSCRIYIRARGSCFSEPATPVKVAVNVGGTWVWSPFYYVQNKVGSPSCTQ